MRTLCLIACAAMILASCGRSPAPSTANVQRITMFSAGPINSACLTADRKAANRKLCGCIQTVANLTLTPGEQSRAVNFFADPHKAQETRQSDRRKDESFWTRYRGFSNRAERSCKGY
ncbi:MAG: hypothetical protein ACPG7W_09800 [Paracoccaceae bacterium]